MTRNRFRILFILSMLCGLAPGPIDNYAIPPPYKALLAREMPSWPTSPILNEIA